jgi:hypothetical protein
LGSLGLTAVEAKLEGLLERASKADPSYADFLLDALRAESQHQRYLKTRLHLAHWPRPPSRPARLRISSRPMSCSATWDVPIARAGWTGARGFSWRRMCW